MLAFLSRLLKNVWGPSMNLVLRRGRYDLYCAVIHAEYSTSMTYSYLCVFLALYLSQFVMKIFDLHNLLWQAGQVYGVALSGLQLAKPGIFPELRPCGEDFRKKWVEVYLCLVLSVRLSCTISLLNLYEESKRSWIVIFGTSVWVVVVLIWLVAGCQYGGIWNVFMCWIVYRL